MIPANHRVLKSGIVLLSVVVLGCTLTAGFWPFKFSFPNDVSWLPNQDGLRFDKHATLISASPFDPWHFCVNNSVSMELWLEPQKTVASSTVLSFYSPQNYEIFAVRQSLSDFALFRYSGKSQSAAGIRKLYVEETFKEKRKIFFTVTADELGTRVYENGSLIQTAREFGLRCQDLTGVLLVGNSPVANFSWEGTLFGLAFYNRLLGAGEVKQHYDQWTRSPRADLPASLHATSLYLFNEGKGSLIQNFGIQNLGTAGPELNIPNTYTILHQRFLEPFWEEFRRDRPFATDVAINVVGFMPLGFCCAALLSWFLPSKHSLFRSAVLCFLVSLTIEVIQAFMPIRSSGTTDLITNTTGGALGAAVYLALLSSSVVEKMRIQDH
jgi:VanZ like family/Concanavalin A-like lectin/glucanases superfamily